jgi:hypothetical protein
MTARSVSACHWKNLLCNGNPVRATAGFACWAASWAVDGGVDFL